MNTDQTIEQLKTLRLAGMARRYEAVTALPLHEVQNVHELMGSMVQAEIEHRDFSRTQKYLKASRLRYSALPEEITCNAERGITREQVLRLSDGSFIQKAENVLITGATGCGKSFLACALGRSACLLGYRTNSRLALLDILEDRYGVSSVVITSQLPVEAWYNFIDEPTLADAIMDRLTASAHRMELQGKSLRKKKNH